MQTSLFKKQELAYGGQYSNTRKGRSQGRPLVTKQTMHLVLRSSLAKGKWSFLNKLNKDNIRLILRKFAIKYGVKLLHGANVGNHIHLEIQLSSRHAYKPFIRAITAAIAMKITGVSRWNSKESIGIERFWDLRPFTRVVVGWKNRTNLKNYIDLNRLEGRGVKREVAKLLLTRSPTAKNTG